MTNNRRTVFRKPVGIHVAALMVMSGAVAAAFSFGGNEKTEVTVRRVNTPCDGIDVDATRRYKPARRTDAHVEFPFGSLTFAVPGSIPVTTGASGNGKVKFTFNLNDGTPTTCVYRGNGTNAYNFVKCKQAPLPHADPDDDDGDHDDGPSDPLPVAGTIVTADSFRLHINKGDRRAGTTTVHLHLDGPVIDDGNHCTNDSCDPGTASCTFRSRSSCHPRRRRSRTDRSSRTRTDLTRPTRRVMERSSTRTMPSSGPSARTAARA